MRFKAKFEVTHDDGSKLPNMILEIESDSWYGALDIISEKVSNPPYELFYHMDLIELRITDRLDIEDR